MCKHSSSLRYLPSCDVLDFRFTKRAALRELPDAISRRLVALLGHDVRKHLSEELEDVPVDLLKLQQEGVVAFGTVDPFESGVRNARREFLLLLEGEEAVALDSDDESRLLDLRQRVLDWGLG